jgi:uncharacterized protein (DUF934 family)
MPLIDLKGEAENIWVHLPDGADGASRHTGAITVSLGQYRASRDELAGSNTKLGVRLAPEDDVAELESALDDLPLIEISFPRYTDGRGYSQAQLLRQRYGFKGELRAVGHVLRDQVFYMMRSGFTSFDVQSGDVKPFLDSLREFSAVYQKSAAGPEPVFLSRATPSGSE